MTENEGDLISREALKNTAKIKLGDDITSITVLKLFEELIDNAPTVLFPLTVKITDTVTDEDIEV